MKKTMVKGNFFTVALGISIAGHLSLFILWPSSLSFPKLFHPREKEDVEIVYFQISEMLEVPLASTSPQIEPTRSETKTEEVIHTAPSGSEQATNVSSSEPLSDIPGDSGEKKDDSAIFFYEEMQKMLKHPLFLTYYEGIREKIRRAAKQRYRGERTSGDVSLGFTLFSNGVLKEVKVLQENSLRNPALRTMAVQSILDASPFPPLPTLLKKDQLSFVVVLTFERGR